MTPYFPISNDQLNVNNVTECEPISSCISTSQPSNISVHQTSSNNQPLFRFSDFVKNEDYVEFNHYVNDIAKLVTPVTSLSD